LNSGVESNTQAHMVELGFVVLPVVLVLLVVIN
jgi:hypothetical protein